MCAALSQIYMYVCIKIMHINSRAAFPSRKVFCNVHFLLPSLPFSFLVLLFPFGHFSLFSPCFSLLLLLLCLLIAWHLKRLCWILLLTGDSHVFIFVLTCCCFALFFLAFTQINYSNFMQSAGREERDIRGGNFKHFRVVVGVASLVSF